MTDPEINEISHLADIIIEEIDRKDIPPDIAISALTRVLMDLFQAKGGKKAEFGLFILAMYEAYSKEGDIALLKKKMDDLGMI